MMILWGVTCVLLGDGADAADKVADYLTGDPEVYANPEKYFDQVIEINLSNWSHI
jgi:hypothetical protein